MIGTVTREWLDTFLPAALASDRLTLEERAFVEALAARLAAEGNNMTMTMDDVRPIRLIEVKIYVP